MGSVWDQHVFSLPVFRLVPWLEWGSSSVYLAWSGLAASVDPDGRGAVGRSGPCGRTTGRCHSLSLVRGSGAVSCCFEARASSTLTLLLRRARWLLARGSTPRTNKRASHTWPVGRTRGVVALLFRSVRFFLIHSPYGRVGEVEHASRQQLMPLKIKYAIYTPSLVLHI